MAATGQDLMAADMGIGRSGHERLHHSPDDIHHRLAQSAHDEPAPPPRRRSRKHPASQRAHTGDWWMVAYRRGLLALIHRWGGGFGWGASTRKAS